MALRILCMTFVILAGCITEAEVTGVNGTYDVTAWKTSGEVETSGWFTLITTSDSTFWGDWSLKNVHGDGPLAGTINGEAVTWDFFPRFRDHNLIMMGTYRNGRIVGTWQWIGFAGGMSEGTFSAIKRK